MRLEYTELRNIDQHEHSNERVNDMKELVSLVFKSPVFKKEVSTIKNIPVKMSETTDQYGNPQGGENVETHTDTKITTKSEE